MRKQRVPGSIVTDEDLILFILAQTKEDNGCLVWTGSIVNNGYGAVFLHGRILNAHKAMLYAIEGAPPKAKCYALHSCPNKRRDCVTPGHSRWGTQSENIIESYDEGRAVTLIHPKGKDHYKSRLRSHPQLEHKP